MEMERRYHEEANELDRKRYEILLLTIWHCILSAELTKAHSSDCFFSDFAYCVTPMCRASRGPSLY